MEPKAAADANIKTVSVQVTADELKSMSRTRRRRRTPAVQRTEEAQATKVPELPIANTIHVEKKPEIVVAPVATPTVEPKSEPPVKKPIQLGRKRNETRKSSGTTAAAPGTPGARGNGTLRPKIIYSKKRTVPVAGAVFKSPLKLEPVRIKNPKTRRQFRARKIAVTVGGDGLTVRYNNPSKMRAELIRAGIIRSGSRIPDEKLARLYHDFRDLKAGAL